MELMMEHLGHGLGLTLMISLPCVLTAAGVGLVVGILQAVTQVQEQTIAAAPKILAVFSIIILGGGLMMTMLTDYVRESMVLAFEEIPRSEDFILPPRDTDAGRDRARKFFRDKISGKDGSVGAMSNLPGIGGAMDDAKSTNGMHVSITKPNSPLSITEKIMLQKQGH